MIDTDILNAAISNALAAIGEPDAGFVVLVHAGVTLAIGTNIDNPDKAASLCARATVAITDSMEACRGKA
jgi:hypothetical protein